MKYFLILIFSLSFVSLVHSQDEKKILAEMDSFTDSEFTFTNSGCVITVDRAELSAAFSEWLEDNWEQGVEISIAFPASSLNHNCSSVEAVSEGSVFGTESRAVVNVDREAIRRKKEEFDRERTDISPPSVGRAGDSGNTIIRACPEDRACSGSAYIFIANKVNNRTPEVASARNSNRRMDIRTNECIAIPPSAAGDISVSLDISDIMWPRGSRDGGTGVASPFHYICYDSSTRKTFPNYPACPDNPGYYEIKDMSGSSPEFTWRRVSDERPAGLDCTLFRP